jgi:hypothetical protein
MAFLTSYVRPLCFGLLLTCGLPAHAEVPAEAWVAWMSNRESSRHEIYIARVGPSAPAGSEAAVRRLTFKSGEYPTWAPDGRWISYRRHRDDNGRVVRHDGSGDKSICAGTPHFWLADNSGVVCGKNGDFFLVDPDSGDQKLLFSRDDFKHLKGKSIRPGGITADGRWLVAWVYGLFAGGYTADNGTFKSTHATVALDLQDKSKIYYIGPGCMAVAAPSGDFLFHVSRAMPKTQPDILKLSAKDVLTRKSYQLVVANVDDDWGHEYFPNVSNDGKWLAYGASTGCHHWWECDYEIFVHRIGAAPTSRQRITFHQENDSYPALFVGKLPIVPPTPDAAAEDGGSGCRVGLGHRDAPWLLLPLWLLLLFKVRRSRR